MSQRKTRGTQNRKLTAKMSQFMQESSKPSPKDIIPSPARRSLRGKSPQISMRSNSYDSNVLEPSKRQKTGNKERVFKPPKNEFNITAQFFGPDYKAGPNIDKALLAL